MKKLWRLVLIACVISAMAIPVFAVPAVAIQNGTADGNNHPFVCLVVFYDSDHTPLWRTSGELLSPTVS